MAGYNPYNIENNSIDNTRNIAFFSKILKNLSTFGGADFDSMVVKNSVGYNINEDPRSIGATGYSGIYDMFARKATAIMTAEQPIAYLQLGYSEKRTILREYSIKDEIKDFITTISDKAIVYQNNKPFADVEDLSDEYSDVIKAKLKEYYDSIYDAYNFNVNNNAWRYFKKFIIDGFLAFELVFDDKGKNIISVNELDCAQLVYAVDPMSGMKVWVLYPEHQQYRKILLDSQVVYLSYSSSDDVGETSYVEPLIRPYNQLQMLQYTKLNFNLANSMIYREFVVPVKGLSPADAEAEVGNMIADYSDEIFWDDYMGQPIINGAKRIPFSRDIWWPEKESGKPSMEIKQPQGHNLNEDTTLNWFYNVLKRASKLPFTRFDKSNGGGTVFGIDGDITNDDLDFDNFINRLRNIFKHIIIKPLYTQMCIAFPELLKNKKFKKDLNLKFLGNTQAETGRFLNNLKTRSEIASLLMSNLTKNDGTSALHIKYIMKHIMEFTDEMMAENEKYFLEDEQKGITASGEPAQPNLSDGDMGGDMGGSQPADDNEPAQQPPIDDNAPVEPEE